MVLHLPELDTELGHLDGVSAWRWVGGERERGDVQDMYIRRVFSSGGGGADWQ